MTALALARASRRCGLRSVAIDKAPVRGWKTVDAEH